MAESNAAHEHILVMQSRIAKQRAAIKWLEEKGEDTAAAGRRLDLLNQALKDLRLQLGQVSPTTQDEKREARQPPDRPNPPARSN